MLKRNSDMSHQAKQDDTADKEQKYTYCFAYAAGVMNDKIQWQITKSEDKSVWLWLCFDYISNNFDFGLT